MTTEQRERIQEAVKPGTLISFRNGAECREFCEAVGFPSQLWHNREYIGRRFEPDGSWTSPSVRAVDGREFEGYRILAYKELLEPISHPLIIGLRAAARAQGINLEWLDVDVPFGYKGEQFVVALDDGVPKVLWWNEKDRCSYYSVLTLMFAHPDQIHPIPKYSAETVEMAKAFERTAARAVKRWKCGTLWLMVGDMERIGIDKDLFPEIQPGQCVALADILGGEGDV